MEIPLSPWSTKLFNDKAEAVRSRIGLALRDMQGNAEAAQMDADCPTNEPYGTSRWAGSFARLADEVGTLDGARLIKPKGYRFKLVLVEHGLLFPFRYAKKKADVGQARIPNVTDVMRDLFRLAPNPSQPVGVQEDLFGSVPDREIPSGAGRTPNPWTGVLPSETKLVLIPYACNADGLLDAFWGVAALRDDLGRLEWVEAPEPLPMPAAPASKLKLVLPKQTASQHRSFNEGAQPSIILSRRPDADRERDVPPTTEPTPTKPQTSENDEN